MQKSLLITIVLILLVQGLVHGQSNDEEQESANNTVYYQFMMKVDQKFETWSEQLANVLEQLAQGFWTRYASLMATLLSTHSLKGDIFVI
jgi:predicted negative regulator of RcsB-dependent stress response